MVEKTQLIQNIVDVVEHFQVIYLGVVVENSMILMWKLFHIERHFLPVSCSSSLFVPEFLQVLENGNEGDEVNGT